MDVVTDEPTQTKSADEHDLAQKHIRWSSFLLAGRLLSVGINFVSQVLVVRYLSTTDYGAWAYALSVVALCQSFATIGLDKATTRFVPIYHEKGEYDKLFGTILLVFGSILLSGLVIITAFYAFPEQTARLVNDTRQPLALLFIMIFLVPVEAVDSLLIGLFSSFSNPRAIFFRKHLLGPGLKLGVVLLLILRKSEVTFLAYGYLAASALGVLIYGCVLARMLSRERLFENFRLSQIKVPAREIFAFTLPLTTSDLVTVLMLSSDVMMLGYFYNMKEVAYFRVVLPAAALNAVVMWTFALLYTPAAARLFAREDYAGINDLYWRTAVWMAVLSFPIFAVTFSLSRPLTVLLYGARYEQSGVILALLSVGYYFDVALGFNKLTLQIVGKMRYIVTINLLACFTNVAVNLLLIPRFGALGAALGTAGTRIIYNILTQAGLRLASGISLFDKKYSSFYLTIALSAAGLIVIRLFSPDNMYVVLTLVCLVSLLVVALSKKNLKVRETFPELVKLPLMRLLLT